MTEGPMRANRHCRRWNEGDEVVMQAIAPEQHFHRTAATLFRSQSGQITGGHGIGRPSTYASIMSTLVGSRICELDKRASSRPMSAGW